MCLLQSSFGPASENFYDCNIDVWKAFALNPYTLFFKIIPMITVTARDEYVGFVCGWRSGAKGKAVLPFEYLTPYFGYFILPPRCLVGVTSCPRKFQKNYTKEKTETDKRRRRFFNTFLYLLGSTTIPWMREFFLKTSKWWILQLRCQKYVKRFHVCMCPHLVFRAFIRVSFLLEVCQSP